MTADSLPFKHLAYKCLVTFGGFFAAFPPIEKLRIISKAILALEPNPS